MRPLYAGKRIENLESGGNRGLFWNKFVDKWPSPENAPAGDDEQAFKPLGGENKKDWIREFTGSVAGAAKAARRVQNLAARLNGHQCRTFVTTAPFVTGMGLAHPVENGFLWHHTLGVPYLPGSSVKGLVRAWMEHWRKEKQGVIHRLFGKDTTKEAEGRVGNLIFFDAFPVSKVQLIAEVMTPHDGGWRQVDTNQIAPSDWHNPNPIPFLAIAPGARFQFCIAPRPGGDATEEDAETAMNCLEEALEWLGAGAKTAVGFGRFEDAGASWQEGDVAFYDLAGGLEVTILEVDEKSNPTKVRNNKTGQVINQVNPSLLVRKRT